MGKNNLLSSFISNSKSNVSVIEGVMGYYDGFGGDSNYASTHHVHQLQNHLLSWYLMQVKLLVQLGDSDGFRSFTEIPEYQA